ncbi:hypothetical protein DXV76_15370 [Rhodobacteraceae bacterium CCMM004]|nr:hypothetical protein DXV76_15370 [Rhodobacteraceae bacterium CCMM004]
MLSRAFLALALLAAPAAATAADWCRNGGLNPTEATICNDNILLDLDARLNAAFDAAAGRVSMADQNDWLRNERDVCGRDLFCIERAYRDRIAALANAPVRGPDPLMRPWCDASRLNATERAICSDETLADLDAALGAVYGAQKAARDDAEQNRWLRGDRDACGADRDCIAASYLRRIVDLGGRLRRAGG